MFLFPLWVRLWNSIYNFLPILSSNSHNVRILLFLCFLFVYYGKTVFNTHRDFTMFNFKKRGTLLYSFPLWLSVLPWPWKLKIGIKNCTRPSQIIPSENMSLKTKCPNEICGTFFIGHHRSDSIQTDVLLINSPITWFHTIDFTSVFSVFHLMFCVSHSFTSVYPFNVSKTKSIDPSITLVIHQIVHWIHPT